MTFSHSMGLTCSRRLMLISSPSGMPIFRAREIYLACQLDRSGSSGIAENPLRPGSWQESCGTLRTFVGLTPVIAPDCVLCFNSVAVWRLLMLHADFGHICKVKYFHGDIPRVPF